jgi:uncharacterized GH25 family protein
MFSRTLILGAFATSSLLAGRASAHAVWLEQEGKGAKLYFGEFGDNQREVSPGFLDKLGKPTATLLSPKGEKELAVSKETAAFAVAGHAGKGESLVVVDPRYPVMERKEGDKPLRTAWTPAARFVTDLSAQAPKLPLDVVPAGASGEFQVVYQGKPLPKAKVNMLAVSGWGREGQTDEQGKVRFDLPWRGRYLVLVRHVDKTPGKRDGATGPEAYDAASFATTLSFVTSAGLPSPPRPPVAPPNK